MMMIKSFCVALFTMGMALSKTLDTPQMLFNLSDASAHDNLIKSVSESCVQVKQANIILLNKITAKREILLVSSDSEIKFGSLLIRILECWKALDPTKSDNLIFVEIFECTNLQEQNLILRGWLSSSYPGYSVLEHYAYAIAVLECF